jgi:hypothetical protein
VGTLSVTAQGNISEGAESLVRVAGLATLDANNAEGAVDLSTGDNQFGTLAIRAATASINTSATATLAGTVAQSYTITALGDILSDSLIDVGVLRLNANSGAGNVSLQNEGNRLVDVSLTAAQASLVNSGTTTLSDIQAGSIDVSSVGDILDGVGAPLSVTGRASLITSGNIFLGNNSDDMVQIGSLAGASRNLNIVQSGDIAISDLVVANTASFNSLGGSISSAIGANVSIAGDTSFAVNTVSGVIDVGGSSNAFGDLTLTGSNVKLAETDIIRLDQVAADQLTLTAGSAISNLTSASVSISGQTTLAATNVTLGTLATDTMNFGRLNLNVSSATINESSSTEVGIVTAGSLILSSVGSMSDTAASAVTVAGTANLLVSEGTRLIDLDAGNHSIARLSATGGDINVKTNSDLQIGSLTAGGGAGLNLTVNGLASITSGGSLVVDQQANIRARSLRMEAQSTNQVGGLAVTITDVNDGFVEIQSDIRQRTLNSNPSKPDGAISILAPRVTLGTADGNVKLVTQGSGAAGTIFISGVDAAGNLVPQAGDVQITGSVTIDTTNSGVSGGAATTLVTDGVSRGSIRSVNTNLASGLTIISGTGNVALGDFVQGQELDSLTVNGGNIDVNDIYVTGNTVNLSAKGSITGAGVISDSVGNVSVVAAGDINLARNVAAQGSIDLTSTTGLVSVQGAITAGNNLNVDANSNVVLGGSVSVQGGAASTASITSSAGSVDLGSSVTTAGRLSLAAASTILLGSDVNAGTAVIVGGDNVTFAGAGSTIATSGDLVVASSVGSVDQVTGNVIDAGGKLTVSAQTGMAIASMNGAGNVTLAILGLIDSAGNLPLFSRVEAQRTVSSDLAASRDVTSGDTLAFLAPSADVGATDSSQNFSLRATEGIFYGLTSGEFFAVDIGVSPQLPLLPSIVQTDFVDLFSDTGSSEFSGAISGLNVFDVNSFDSIVNTIAGVSITAGTAGETAAASNSRSTAALQQDDEDEVAEVDEVAFQDLKNYDENFQGILLPQDQRFAYDDDGNSYFMATMRSQDNVERVPSYKVRMSMTRQDATSCQAGPSSQAYYSNLYPTMINLSQPSGNVAGE